KEGERSAEDDVTAAKADERVFEPIQEAFALVRVQVDEMIERGLELCVQRKHAALKDVPARKGVSVAAEGDDLGNGCIERLNAWNHRGEGGRILLVEQAGELAHGSVEELEIADHSEPRRNDAGLAGLRVARRA